MNDVREDLKAYIDGELSSTRRTEIEAILEHDEALRQEVQDMFQITKSLSALRRPVEVPADGRPVMTKKRKRLSPPALAAIGVFGIALFGAVVFPVFAQSKVAARKSLPVSEMSKMPASAPAAVPGYQSGSAPKNTQPEVIAPGADQSDRAVSSAEVTSKKSATTAVPPIHTPPFNPANQHREVIRQADVNLAVKDVRAASDNISLMAKGLGGFVTTSKESFDKTDTSSASLTIRVPSGSFEEAMRRIESVGEVTGRNVSGDDVTAQVVDNEARLRALKAEESSLISILKASHRVGDILEIRERLTGVRQEIESLSSQLSQLKDLSSLSTINVTLNTVKSVEANVDKGWFGDSVVDAFGAFKGVTKFLVTLAMYVLALSPLWLISWLIYRFVNRPRNS